MRSKAGGIAQASVWDSHFALIATGTTQMNKVDLAITFLLALGSAAVVAYSTAYVAHYNLGVPSSELRWQALISATLIFCLVTIEFLAAGEK